MRTLYVQYDAPAVNSVQARMEDNMCLPQDHS